MIKRLLLLCLLTYSTAFGADVLVRAWADDDYIRPRFPDGQLISESCAFVKGKYHPGEFESTEEPAIPFEEVAIALRDQLAKRSYLMAENPVDAEFLLVVHWGQTTVETEEVDDFSFDDEDSFESNFDSVPESVKQRNAEIIGATKMNDMHIYSMQRQRLEEAANQERYFINVIALSMADLKQRIKGEPVPKPKWITQLSLPLGRSEYADAIASMSETASAYFGENVKNLEFIREGTKRGTVSIGELEFLEYIDKEPTK
jgi:hypothetical protein